MTLSTNQTNFRHQAHQLKDELISWRRYLHQHPELGFEEENTQRFIQSKLEEFSINYQSIAKTGTVALIEGKIEGPTFALRADMDALPIQEENEVSYVSKIPGKGHMCGHDSHVAMLLGAAKLLIVNPPERGNVKLIFQPAEEGGFGARAMVEEGVLLNPNVDAIAALHVYAKIPTGEITSEYGISCAASDFFEVEILGRGGHGAHPHLAIDPITTAAEVISSIQHIISRQIDPLSPAVITIGKIQGGVAHNVIPASVTFGGTVRTLDPKVRESMKGRLEQIIKGVTQAHGASYKLNYEFCFPSIVHDRSLVPILEETSKVVLGENKLTFGNPSMGGEDFSFFTQEVPGITFRLGVGNESKGAVNSLHHPKFDIDEDALELGAAMLAQLAVNYLDNK